MLIALLFNEPTLPVEHPDYASEAGVLESVQAFEQAAAELGWACVRVGVKSDVRQLWQAASAIQADVVVNLCEGFAGESRHEAHVAGLLELCRLPYTGATPDCMSLAHDKRRTKQLLWGAGLPSAACWHVPRSGTLPECELQTALAQGPLFVKPAAEDASLGISPASVVANWAALTAQVERLAQQYGDVLIETYLPGREFNLGVIALPEWQALPVAEIEFTPSAAHPWPIVTYDSKWDVGSAADLATPVRCPADVSPELAAQLSAVALAAAQATGCRDYVRIDLRLDAQGNPHVLEVNANPDLSPTAGFARALRAAGWSYTQFVQRLVESAAARRTAAAPVAVTPIKNTTAPGALAIRSLYPDDKSELLAGLAATDMFRPDEIAIADEVLSEALRDGPAGHYQVRVADYAGRPVGWTAYGLVPLTDATYDLYWIAVHPDFQRHGVGRALIADCVQVLRTQQARWLLAETSGLPVYEKTRAFYLRTGFTLVGDVPDFYRPGDGRLTYGLRTDADRSQS